MNPDNLPLPRGVGKRGVFAILRRIAFAILALLLVAFGIWRVWVSASVHSKVAAMREMGFPTDWKDLETWPRSLTEDQNVAFVFGRAFDVADSNTCDRILGLDLPVRGAAITNRSQILECIRSNLAAMEIVYGITNASQTRYPVNFMDGPAATLPHLARLKAFARLFCWDAVLKADQKDAAGAVQDIQTCMKLSHSLDAEPFLISQLVSAAVLAIDTQALERTLERATLTDDQLKFLIVDFSRTEATNRFWMAMVGEKASYNESIRLLNDDPRMLLMLSNRESIEGEQTYEPPSFSHGYFMKLTGFWVRDRNFFLQAMDTNIAAFAAGPPASLQFTNAFNQIETNAHKRLYMMSSMLLPGFSRVVTRDADTRARLRTAMAAMALERWRIAHNGSIPNSLTDLVPDFFSSVPLDPYNGQPLRFKKLPKGYVVYSIGPNGEDDGGKERIPSNVKVPREERNNYDITFTVER